MRRAVIVGFGCAGYHTAKALRDAGYQEEIAVYSDRNDPPSNPMLTTYYASGAIPYEKQFVFGSLEDICRRLSLVWHGNSSVRQIDPSGTLVLSDGTAAPFDKLAICTGAVPFIPNIPGVKDERVFCVRTLEDACRLRTVLDEGKVRQALVVGASMIGIKIVELLSKAGVQCILNDSAPCIFPLAALPETAGRIEDRLSALNITQKYGSGIASFQPAGHRLEAMFGDGTKQTVDIAILCIGTRASVSMVDPRQISVDRGILVNESMQTNIPAIYAAGDCCQGANLLSGHPQIIGLWANAAAQGKTAGRHMAGLPACYHGTVPHNITHFLDMDFFSCGDNRVRGEIRKYETGDCFVETLSHEGRLVCVNMLNNAQATGAIKQAFIKQLTDAGVAFDPKTAAALDINGFQRALYQRVVCGQ